MPTEFCAFKPDIFFGAVRKADDTDVGFILSGEIGYSNDKVTELIERTEEESPMWHEANPVQRVIRFRIEELV